MQFKILFSCLIILASLTCQAQNQSVIDSLKNELKISSDKERVDLLNSLINQYHRTDSVQATLYWQEVKKLAEQLNYTTGLAEAHYYYALMLMLHGYQDAAEESYLNGTFVASQEEGNYILRARILNGRGINVYYQGDYDKAKSFHYEALELLDTVDDSRIRAQSWQSIANAWYSQGESDSARHYYDLALQIHESNNDVSSMALCLNNIGNIYKYQSNYPKALDYFFKTLEIDQSLQDSINMAMDYNNIGAIYQNQGNTTLALDYMLRGLKIRESRSSKRSLLNSYYNIGWVYSGISDFENAKSYFEKSLELSKQTQNLAMIAFSSSGLGDVHLNLGAYEKAEKYLQDAVSIRQDLGLQLEWVQSITLLGKLALIKGEYQKSKAYLEDALDVAKELNAAREISIAARIATDLSAKIGNYKSAYDYHVLHKAMDDNLKNEDNTRKITLLEADFKYEQERQQIASENKANLLIEQQKLTVQRYYTYAAICGLAVIVFVTFIIYRNYRQKKQANDLLGKQNKQINEQAQDLEEKNKKLLELDQFKQDMTSMVVHDLKNPLSIIIQKGEQKTASIARKMLNLVLNILDVQKFEDTKVELHKEKIPLSKIIENAIEEVKDLLGEKNLTIETQGEDFEIEADVELMQRVVTNLLTNAIKYSPLNVSLQVAINETNDGLVEFMLTDQGPGIPKEKQAIIFDRYIQADKTQTTRVKSTGLGLAFCKLTVEAHGGKIGVISEEGTGASFWFTLNPESEASELSVSSPQTNAELSSLEKEKLLAMGTQLKDLKIYESTELEKLLQRLKPEKDSALEHYSEQLINASYQGNEEAYENLLKAIYS